MTGLGGAVGIGYWLRQHGRQGQVSNTTQRAGHLLRRAGFGPTAAELSAAVKAGLPATIDVPADTVIPASYKTLPLLT